jgi:uncharacterized protein YecT (DUF1311 family)
MLIVLAAVAALAQDPAQPEALPCPEPLSALGDLAMRECLDQALRWEEARMRRYWNAASEAVAARSPETQTEAFVDASQAAWAAYAEIACQGVAEEQGPGSLSGMALRSCMIELMRERSETLWRHYGLGDLDDEAQLPEPTVTVREEKLAAAPEPVPNPGSLPYGS